MANYTTLTDASDTLIKEKTMTTLTEYEQIVLTAFIDEGLDATGAEEVDELLEDNMTWMDPDDLVKVTEFDKQQLGGIMASLSEKGLIEDSGEPLPERRINAWTATEKGITIGWEYL